MLNFVANGEGKTVVYLHGFLESITMWSFLNLHELKTQNIFIDLPGHGNSELTIDEENPSLDFMANEVLEVLDFLNTDSYSVVGHSMGGYVGLLLKQLDKRCQQVILLNSNFWEDNEQKKKDRVRVAEIAFKSKNIFIHEAIPNLFAKPENYRNEIENLKNEALKMLPESIAYSALAMRNRRDFTNKVNENLNDYFVIHGMLDKLVDDSYLKTQLKSDKNLFLLKNAGHMAHIEQSEQVLKILNLILC